MRLDAVIVITINKEQEQDIIAVSSYEETTFLSCSPMHCDSRGQQEHNICKELLAQEDHFPNASAVVVTILVVKAAVAHHHHHQTNNKILLTDFTDSTSRLIRKNNVSILTTNALK